MQKEKNNSMQTGLGRGFIEFRVSNNWHPLLGGSTNQDYSVLGSIGGASLLKRSPKP